MAACQERTLEEESYKCKVIIGFEAKLKYIYPGNIVSYVYFLAIYVSDVSFGLSIPYITAKT